MMYGYLAWSFDLLNVRDLDLIAQASALCERLVVGVFDDSLAESLFGRPPVVPLEERTTLLKHVRGVDEVVVHSDEIILEAPDNYAVFTIAGLDLFADLGVEIISLTPMRNTNSPILRDALQIVPERSVA